MSKKKKWEEISYEDIKIGDYIRESILLGENGGGWITIGEVVSSDSTDASFRLDTGQWIFPASAHMEDYDNLQAVYTHRKVSKPVPFVFPEGLGAVIRGKMASGLKPMRTIIQVGEDNFYIVELRTHANKHEINLFYTDLVVISEGSVIDDGKDS